MKQVLAHITTQAHQENSSLAHWLSTDGGKYLIVGIAVLVASIAALHLAKK